MKRKFNPNQGPVITDRNLQSCDHIIKEWKLQKIHRCQLDTAECEEESMGGRESYPIFCIFFFHSFLCILPLSKTTHSLGSTGLAFL